MIDEPTRTHEWLSQLREGKSERLTDLFNYYRPRLSQMVRLRMNPRLSARVDPSDVLQEVYLDAAQQIQRYTARPAVAFYVWLRGLAWERLIKIEREHLGAKRRAADRERSLPAESSVLRARELLAHGTSPTHAVLRGELRLRVQHALESLDRDDREVILMRHFENMSNAEVAQTLGVSDSGATMRHGRALARLKQLLTEELNPGESRL